MKLISVVTPCFNEEQNIKECYLEVKSVFGKLEQYSYEHIFIDNASKDRTVSILKEIAQIDKNLKIIVNTRNFGYIRSPHHALLQAKGDAVINIAADLQEPPSLIKDFIKKWEEGYKIVIGIKNSSKESIFVYLLRSIYYNVVNKLSDIELIKQFSGYGLYDKDVIDLMKGIDDPYPYFRGLIAEIGFERAEIEYVQSKREKGKSKSNFLTLYDVAMLGIISHSKVPLRLATITGFFVSIFSLIIGFIYLIYKIIYFDRFEAGIAPIVIGFFFFAAVQLFFIGIIGEYIGAIYTQVKNNPIVVEKERINFDIDDS